MLALKTTYASLKEKAWDYNLFMAEYFGEAEIGSSKIEDAIKESLVKRPKARQGQGLTGHAKLVEGNKLICGVVVVNESSNPVGW